MSHLLSKAALLLARTISPALAQREGSYQVEGQSGTSAGPGPMYNGTAQFERINDTFWRVTWRVGRDTFRGLGIRGATNLSVGYVSDGEPGVIVYDVQPDGTMLGIWAHGRGGTNGMERLTPR